MAKARKAKPRTATRKKAAPVTAPTITTETIDGITAVVDTQTGEFVPEGHVADTRYLVVPVPRNPDHLCEKWDGSAIVAKTTAEMAAAADAKLEAQAVSDLQRAILATMLTMFKSQTGAFPTAAQRATLRANFITVWKQLG